MTRDEQGEALLQAILDEPDDDAVRLVYADWMEENGQGERAEFVRVQVALEDESTDWRPLRERELALFDRLGREGLVGYGEMDVFALGINSATSFRWGAVHPVKPGETLALIRRGFVESVRCTLDAWRRHGPAIVRAHPVLRVEITDKAPDGEEDGLYRWQFYDQADEEDSLPLWLQGGKRDQVEWVSKTKEGAIELLSLACLKWAKATCPTCLGKRVIDVLSPAGLWLHPPCPDCAEPAQPACACCGQAGPCACGFAGVAQVT